MYREDWGGWTAAEREAIRAFREGFTPEVTPGAYHYDAPVVVLLDQKSFSATDIFLAALKGWPGVKLVGYPSGGGSARRMGVRLPESRIGLSLASMASFQWSGQLFDGNGVQPDIVVDPLPEYFLLDGRDNILERAIDVIGR
jgi:C-terminal processing protease CtpA/Prc